MIENYALMAATLIGPILAIQAQKWIERWTEKRNRKLDLFKTLMATRAYRLSHAHVEALNMIEIEFYDCRNSKGKKVMESWRSYFDNLADSDLQKNDHKTWLSQQDNKFMSKQIRDVRIEQIRDVRFLFFCAGGGAGFYPQIHSPFFEGPLQSPLLWGLWSCG